MEVVLVILAFAGVALAIRVVAGGMDHGRVDDYIQSKGGRVLERHWNPLGKGWVGERNARIYELSYVDKDGNEHQATCKTSMFAGVYLTDDKVVKTARKPDSRRDTEDLAAENRRLQEELEELRRQRR